MMGTGMTLTQLPPGAVPTMVRQKLRKEVCTSEVPTRVNQHRYQRGGLQDSRKTRITTKRSTRKRSTSLREPFVIGVFFLGAACLTAAGHGHSTLSTFPSALPLSEINVIPKPQLLCMEYFNLPIFTPLTSFTMMHTLILRFVLPDCLP